MNNQSKKVIITASILPKTDEKMRLCAVKEKLSLGELLEKYQNAYDKILEAEKEDKKLNRELKEKGKVNCPRCGSETEKFLTASQKKK